MARIGKAEHARILHLADVERRRVADIAAEYGCSPANIYTLLGKLRRAAPATVAEEIVPAAPAAAPIPTAEASVVDLFAAPPRPTPAAELWAPEPAPRPAAPVPAPTPLPRAQKAPPVKPGYGLVMRPADGEDSLAPFRSLEDLLGAIKPILRAAASSPEPVWFCIQPVDLATLAEDAA